MNTAAWISAAMFLGTMAIAQVVPTTPTKFTKKVIGGGSGSADIGVTPPPKQEPMVRMTTYVALSEARQWTSTDGKPLLGKLIAFQDLVVQTTKAAADAAAAPQMPALQGKPIVVQNAKVRLLVNQRPFEVPLERLSAADRQFVEQIQIAIAAK